MENLNNYEKINNDNILDKEDQDISEHLITLLVLAKEDIEDF
jgi:hypothetical protein